MEWKRFFLLAAEQLSQPINSRRGKTCSEGGAPKRRSWCVWTTFPRLSEDARYWAAELPRIDELTDTATKDGGAWSQPFPYSELAHLLIPRHFEENYEGDWIEGHPPGFWLWTHTQNVDGLSLALGSEGIPHHLSEYALEIKLF